MAHGGKRDGAGRKAKADELELIEKLSPLDDLAFKALKDGVKAGEFQYVKMFMEYRYGKPKEKVDVTTDGEKINAIQVEVVRSYVKGSD